LVGSETFDCENLVVIIEKLGIDGRVWHEEAVEISIDTNISCEAKTYKTTTENRTVRSPQARKMIW
jgi:hypothetical protein